MKHIPILIGILILSALSAFGQNLLTLNPGFEDGTKGWKGIDGSYWTISKAAAPWSDGGEKALQRVAYKGSKEGAVWTRWNEQKIPVKAGETYTLSAGMSGVGGGTGSWTLCPVLQVLDAAGKEIAVLEGGKLARSSSAAKYSRLSANFTMPETAVQARVGVRIAINKELSATSYLRFDALSLSVAGAEQPAQD